MKIENNIELESLVGLHVLDARGEFVGTKDEWQDRDPLVVVYRLDGVLYWFQEDPNDGYRSSLGFAQVVQPDDIPSGGLVAFDPIVVTCHLQTKPEPDSYRSSDHRLYGVNESTGAVLFAVGTENTDDYYPCFVSEWNPDGYLPRWLPSVERDD